MQASSVRPFVASLARSARRPQRNYEAVHLLNSIASRKAGKGKQRAQEESQDGSNAHEDPRVHLPHARSTPGKPFDLAAFHRIFDIHPSMITSATPHTQTVRINEIPMFQQPSAEQLNLIRMRLAGNRDGKAALANDASNRFSENDLRNLHRYPLSIKRVVNMTAKGKISSFYCMMVVGNGRGLVGYGEGKAPVVGKAADKAFVQAVKNMDYVQRKDDRTVWTDMSGKWSATTVELRSRPPGFGLRCGPVLHQVAKAAGILDLSGKVRGSRNDMNTVKAAIQLLHGGSAPIALGDITGKKKMARRFKGAGMRTASEIGMDLGRRVMEMR